MHRFQRKLPNGCNQVMSKMRYVPHAAARNLASRKTRVIGLLLNNLHNDFFVPLLNGVEAVVRKKGYNLIVATYHANSRDHMPRPSARTTRMDCWFFQMG
jgi:LacI family transcriptional regulator